MNIPDDKLYRFKWIDSILSASSNTMTWDNKYSSISVSLNSSHLSEHRKFGSIGCDIESVVADTALALSTASTGLRSVRQDLSVGSYCACCGPLVPCRGGLSYFWQSWCMDNSPSCDLSQPGIYHLWPQEPQTKWVVALYCFIHLSLYRVYITGITTKPCRYIHTPWSICIHSTEQVP